MKTFMIENNVTLRNTIQILLTYHNTYPLLLIIAKRDFLTGYRRIVLLSHPTHIMNTKKDWGRVTPEESCKQSLLF